MRQRGFTLIEMMIALSLFGIMVIAVFALMDNSEQLFDESTVRQYTQLQARTILDRVADDFRNSAAWDLFQVHNTSPGGPGSGGPDSVTRLTKWWASNNLTRGTASQTAPFSWAVLDASTDGVAFLRIKKSWVPTGAVNGYNAYLILDYEPQETWTGPPSTATADIGLDGATPVNHQPGRMDDDPHRDYILYRVVTSTNSRLKVQRVRSIAKITNDGNDSGTGGAPANSPPNTGTQLVVDVGDLGPVASKFPTGVTAGKLEIQGIDTGNTTTGVGVVYIHVVCKGIIRGRGAPTPDVITADLATQVTISAAVPPY